MCGRFGLNHPHPVLADWYRIPFMPELKPRYNIAPTMDIPVIRTTKEAVKGRSCAGDSSPIGRRRDKSCLF